MASATICRTTFIVQVVAIYAILVSPLFTKPIDFADMFSMAYGTTADLFSLMTLVVKFHAMFEYENISSK